MTELEAQKLTTALWGAQGAGAAVTACLAFLVAFAFVIALAYATRRRRRREIREAHARIEALRGRKFTAGELAKREMGRR